MSALNLNTPRIHRFSRHYKLLLNTVYWFGGANSGLLTVYTSERGAKEALTL